MTDSTLAPAGRGAPSHQQLTPTEQALLEGIRIEALRKLATAVWRIKLRLQFTGWLQYLIPAVIATGIFVVSAIVQLVFGAQAGVPFAWLAAIVLSVTGFDLITVKFRLRLPEALPRRRERMDLFDLMRARRSCRSFQTRKLTDADRGELLDIVRSEMQAPHIGRAPIRFEYVSERLTVWPTVNASEFLVAIAPLQYDRVAVIDVGRSLQRIVMAATRMGLGTCWIGPGADHASIMRVLGPRFDPARDHIICVCAVGYKSWYLPLFLRLFNAQFRRRLPLEALFFSDRALRQPLDTKAEPFKRFARTYEICEWAPSSYNGQTTRCAAVTKRGADGTRTLERFDFFSVTHSRYYAPVAVGIWCANWELGCEALGIRGHFAGLRQDPDAQVLPRYELSWVPEEPLAAG